MKPESNFIIVLEVTGTSGTSTACIQRYMETGQEDGVQEIVQGLDVALRTPPSLRFLHIGRSFFISDAAEKLDNILNLLYGHYQALSIGANSATLNIDREYFVKSEVYIWY